MPDSGHGELHSGSRAHIQLGTSRAPTGTPVGYPVYSPEWPVVRAGSNEVGRIAVRRFSHRVVEWDTPGWDPVNPGGPFPGRRKFHL